MVTVIRSARIQGEAVTLAVEKGQQVDSTDITNKDVAKSAVPAVSVLDHLQSSVLPDVSWVNAAMRPIENLDSNNKSGKELLTVAGNEDGVGLSILNGERLLAERERQNQVDAQAAHQKALEEGYKEGFKQGEAEGRKTYEEQLIAFQRLLESGTQAFQNEIVGHEDVIIGIAFEAICKIVGDSLHDREGVLAVVKEIIAKVKDQENLAVRISPSDYYLLNQNESELLVGLQGIKLELIPDDRVVLGGCMVETSGGTLDGRLEIQIQQLRDSLLSAKKMLPE